MAIRKNVRNLTSGEKAELVNSIKELKARGRYDLYVMNHANAIMHKIHRCPGFLSWHRQFLLEYEKELQEISGNLNLGLPYWNWAEDMELGKPEDAPVWGNDLMGGNGDPTDNYIVKSGPFRVGEWEIISKNGNSVGPLVREFGLNIGSLPNQNDVDNALNTIPYDAHPWNWSSNPSFRNRLEGWYGATGPGLHNRGHVWVGGSMMPMTSPNDPVFFLHHCFVDKIWADWQDKHLSEGFLPMNGGPAGQNFNDPMELTVSGSIVTHGEVWKISNLEYAYDTETVNV